MKKHLILAVLALGLSRALLADTAPVWKLDASASTLTASALKNESVTVAVKFPALTGSLDPATGKASVTADLKSLETGNPARNTNIETLFFEVAKKAAYGSATFTWKGNVSALTAGTPLDVTLTGELKLHGTKTKIGGPATVSLLADGSYKASFSGWKLDIDALKLSGPLAAMNKICPQPHRVANEVGLKGDLVFKKQ